MNRVTIFPEPCDPMVEAWAYRFSRMNIPMAAITRDTFNRACDGALLIIDHRTAPATVWVGDRPPL